jgi:hypothetical protein
MAKTRLSSLVINILLILDNAALTRALPNHAVNRLQLNSRRHPMAMELRVGAMNLDSLISRDSTCCPGMLQTCNYVLLHIIC